MIKNIPFIGAQPQNLCRERYRTLMNTEKKDPAIQSILVLSHEEMDVIEVGWW